MKKYDLIYFMGDSWTYAIGQAEDINNEINYNNRWSRIVADHFALPEFNKERISNFCIALSSTAVIR